MDNFFSKFQCGFRKGCSTQQCLLALIEKWKSAFDKGKSFGALLTNLSKAFDYLPPRITNSKVTFVWVQSKCTTINPQLFI